MPGFLDKLLGRAASDHPAAGRRRLAAEQWPAVVYAVGDVHGCVEQLRVLTRKIVDDAATIAGEKWLVMLGDYVDRGPDSAGVLDLLCSTAPPGFKRISLVGNHEIMMQQFLRAPAAGSSWLGWGGLETLMSYGVDSRALQGRSAREIMTTLQSHIPQEHQDFLENLPISLSIPGVTFVHAGIRPGVAMDEQVDEDLVWLREPFLSAPPSPGLRVVHGHTPGSEPVVTDGRICLDTGAFATGTLTAARLFPSGEYNFIAAGLGEDE